MLPILGYVQKATKYCKINKKNLYTVCYGLRPPLNTAKQSKVTKTQSIKLHILGYIQKPTKYCKSNKKNLYTVCYGLPPPLNTANKLKLPKNLINKATYSWVCTDTD